MAKFALFVILDAKPGQEAAVEAFLRDSQPIVQDEPGTVAWFGLRMGPSTFGIFDAFPDEAGRQAHLSGRVAAALTERAPELFASAPRIEKLDVLAAKLPLEATPGRSPDTTGSIRNRGGSGGHGIPLERAPDAYWMFDLGPPRRFVIDPHDTPRMAV